MDPSMRGQRSRARRTLQKERPNISATTARTKVWLEVDGRFLIGEGGLHLLDAIDRLGALAPAVREIGWSYRHGWGYLRHARHVLGTALTATRPGRGAARGMVLTDQGRAVLRRLRVLRARLDRLIRASGLTANEVAARGRRADIRRRAAGPT